MPAESGLAPLFAGADLADAFAIALPAAAPNDPLVLATCVFGSMGSWVRLLLRLRDGIMAPFGVKTTDGIRRALAAGGAEHVGFFRVQEKTPPGAVPAEIIMGEDDRHLNFRAAVLVRPAGKDRVGTGDAAREVVAVTVVRCHNRLGRSYLFAITPFHKAVVRSSLNRASRSGWRPPAARDASPGRRS
ncbi:DUF2867 domain-containing protein [Marinibaculum pumilum]|uniref:DUF2867 domain-containing protein n=1 Tax=Marinibaculum pumilum TaxID=1766165 RepID=A0ABV7L9D8_9PROT